MDYRSSQEFRTGSVQQVDNQSRSSGSMLHITEARLYNSREQLSEKHPPIDYTKEGIRRIDSKYESPENLLITTPVGITTPIVISSSMNGLDKPGSYNPALSDCSSDISDATQAWSTMAKVLPDFSEGVTEQDVLQVETFYKAHKTEVCVCRCLANLYFGASKKSPDGDRWEFSTTGIPLLVLDSGDHHRPRKLHILMAEKGTGFTMWKDNIDHLTNYSTPSDKFHTLYLSTDHTKQAGLSFDDEKAAMDFFTFILDLTTDPNDELFNLSKKKKKKKKEKIKKYKAPKKTDISQPCCFVHVTKLERPEFPPPPSRLVDLGDLRGKTLLIPRSASSISEDSASVASEHS